jgi:hypothetical protein
LNRAVCRGAGRCHFDFNGPRGAGREKANFARKTQRNGRNDFQTALSFSVRRNLHWFDGNVEHLTANLEAVPNHI